MSTRGRRVAHPNSGAGPGGRPKLDHVPGAEGDPRLPFSAFNHIAYGDEHGGGHLSGMNIEGKTEYPQSWDEARIVAMILTALRNPSIRKVGYSNHPFDDGTLRAVVRWDDAAGRVVTAVPFDGVGVMRNSRIDGRVKSSVAYGSTGNGAFK